MHLGASMCVLHFHHDCTLFNALFSLVLSTANESPPFLDRVLSPVYVHRFYWKCVLQMALSFALMSLKNASSLAQHHDCMTPRKNACKPIFITIIIVLNVV